MNDRELLELSARAAGMDVRWISESYYGPTMMVMEDESGGPPWNPLTDDGDALRLAVRLAFNKAMSLTWQGGLISYAKPQAAPIWAGEDGRIDPYAATRRAIVRAAAEIVKEMK